MEAHNTSEVSATVSQLLNGGAAEAVANGGNPVWVCFRMAFRASKHKNIIPINIELSGGLNLAAPNHSIADNEAVRMQNYICRVNSNIPITRPAITVVTASAFSDPIVEKSCGGVLCLQYILLYRFRPT